MISKSTFLLRLLMFVATTTVLGCILIWRLIDVQLIRGQDFLTLSEDNRLHSFVVHPDRGVFLDRYGEPLVWNQRTYSRKLDPEALYTKTEPLSQEEALALMATDSAQVLAESMRTYRFPEAFAHTLGYTGQVTADDLKKNRQLRTDELVGRAGLELTQEQKLHGIPGKEVFEINAMGARQRSIQSQPAQPGLNIATTFDPYLSEVAYRMLDVEKGTVVIADAESGEILSLISKPSFNPNLFTHISHDPEVEKQRKAQIADLFEVPNKPLFNRAVSGAYPPGSVFKLVSAAAGLEKGAVDANTVVVDEGVLRVGEYEYGNWYFSQYGRTEGPISLTRAIARSNDIYFYKLAEWTGPNELASFARLFGLGTPTDIQLPGETAGLVPDPAWKQERYGEPWYLGNTYHYGIGQGDVLVSPVQIAQMVQAIENDGKLCRLSLLADQTDRCKELGVKQENISLIKQGMLDACSAGGTGFPFFQYNTSRRVSGAAPEEDLQRGAVACKTGTAEFGGANEQGHRKTHGWFAAIVGLDLEKLKAEAAAQGVGESVEQGAVLQDETLLPDVATSSAQPVSQAEGELQELRRKWLQRVGRNGFPSRLVITVLVESDDANQFKEGSRDAGPVAQKIVEWIEN